jgi:ABC-type sugar transport system ATPase subunit
MSEPLLLEARGISKSFPGVRALNGVQIEVRAGEVHALLGENGAGKSTLMHILAGVYAADEGTLRLNGHEVRFADARAAQKAGVAMVFQERSLAGPLSVAENVFFGRQPSHRCGVIDRGELHGRTRRILDDLGVALQPTALVEHLSPAEQQMVEIAKALSLDARLLVLDEPTSALTETETAALFRTIERLKQRGVGMVYISHRMAEVFQICDRITVLRDGEYQGTFPRDGLTEDELIRRMVGRELETRSSAERGTRNAELSRSLLTSAPAALAIEVRGLHDGLLLHDVSFVARAGEITAFAGLAGSGRTELAMSIFGARPMTAGEVRMGGRPVTIRCPLDAIRAGIGYLPEDRKDAGLFLDMTVAANFAAARLDQFGCWWLDDRAMEQQVAAMAARMRLTANTRGRRVQELSGGNQQKVMLARWLLVHPRVLIVDEPTRGIDIGAKREVHELLRELARDGTAVVFISSELPEVLHVADRILVMREGGLAGELSPAEATEEKILRLAALPHHAPTSP